MRRGVLRYLRARGIGVDRVLIVGSGEVGLTVMRNLMAQPELGFQVVGFVDDDPERGIDQHRPLPGAGQHGQPARSSCAASRSTR